MIKMKDIMLIYPPVLYDIDNIEHAKSMAGHSKFNCIPVISQNGKFAGTLDKSLICQERLQANSTLDEYLNVEVPVVYSDDPISLLAQISLEPEVSILPVLSRDGNLAGVIPKPEFIQDIYGEIISAVKLSVSCEDVNLNSYGIIIIDVAGKIVCFNMNAGIMLGMHGKDICGIHINKVIHDSKLFEVVRKGHTHLKAKMRTDQVDLCTNRFPLYKGSMIVGAIGIFQDMSEGREKLDRNFRNLRGLNLEMVGIMESMHDGIIVMDNYGKVLRINAAFELFTGLTANQILESSIDQMVEWGCLPSVVLSEVLIKKKLLHVIKNINGKDFLIIANPIFGGEGKLNRVVIVLKDIGYLEEIILNLQVTQDLVTHYYHEMELLEHRLDRKDMVASSIAMRKVVSLVEKVAQVDSNVLIMGETGVGKEVVAQSIHKCSNRMDGPFIKLNCSAIPEQLMESELFGYEPGAFTGAKKEGKAGLVELADGGTLFLDEIGDLTLNLQVKLLRVLQEREIIRVGGTKNIPVNFRLIAATNRDLRTMVKRNKFREDLFYRLNVIPVIIPPLRERKEDIVPLIIFLLNKFNKKYGFTKKISPDVIHILVNDSWPGNTRELENVIERLVVTSDTNLIGLNNLFDNTNISRANDNSAKQIPEVREHSEKQLILEAMRNCKNTREMADVLGISQSTVVKKMKKYGIVKLASK